MFAVINVHIQLTDSLVEDSSSVNLDVNNMKWRAKTDVS